MTAASESASLAVVRAGPVATLRIQRPERENRLNLAVREGLANVARHAHARSAAVTVDGRESVGGLSVEVMDDGIGFDPAEARSGLVNLRNRATAHGGTLDIQAGRSGGAALRWHVPTSTPRE